ncbi:hypothetical protein QUB80_17245 [Chlorogloeopsis sp. ULAP01]|uniref:hypothetical protein n=1 Tax=Chlorogloeopsis sp. ULAP01 TaxID=3056483 RepID=UPI0025AA7A44|nr:hypothetical protein [Chlorogloeopsis sp. ULAP01]MDM9382450.1 hypothetical protein [Chlorogloeopsis sp. ULAP01]
MIIASTNYQFFCVDFWLPSDYQSEKNGETFIFAYDESLNLSIAEFSLSNYCFAEKENQEWYQYKNLLKTLAFPLEFYGEAVDFLSLSSAIFLLDEISNRYAWELSCWLRNYICPSWKSQGKINIPRVTDSYTLFQ